jgi:hypothetical protein
MGGASSDAGHRRYVLDKFSDPIARIYCSWHRPKPFGQVGFLRLPPEMSLPVAPKKSDGSTGRAAANHGPVALSFERSKPAINGTL